MNGSMLLLATAVFGVDFGWQPTEYGGFEYIVQIEPELFEIVKSGEPIFNEIPREVRGADRLRIVVGTAKLPREGNPPISTSPPVPATMAPNPSTTDLIDTLNTQLGPLAPPPTNPGFVLPKTNPADPANVETPSAGGNSFKDFVPPALELDKERQIPIPDPDAGSKSNVSNKLNIVAANTGALIPSMVSKAAGLEKTSFVENVQSSEDEHAAGIAEHDQANEEQPASVTDTASESSWTPLTITSLLLFASVGLNFYLGSLARSFYQRCMQLSQQFREDRRRTE